MRWIPVVLLASLPVHGVLKPDPNLTPGVTLPVTSQDVCKPGYAKKVRAVPQALKREVNRRYGIKKCPGEIDHWIPLTLGGSNDVTNLWCQPRPEFQRKDRVEFRLHEEVCKQGLPLVEAQRRVQHWEEEPGAQVQGVVR